MKRLEEAAREYVDDIGFGMSTQSEYYEGYKTCLETEGEEAFIAGVEFAQKWIDVCEELPENNKLIMFKDNMDDIFLGHIENNRYWYAKSVEYGDEEIDYVTHWRPININ